MGATEQIKDAYHTASDWVSEQCQRCKKMSLPKKETRKKIYGFLMILISLAVATIIVKSITKARKDTENTFWDRVGEKLVAIKPLWCLIRKPFLYLYKLVRWIGTKLPWPRNFFNQLFRIPIAIIKAIINYIIFIFKIFNLMFHLLFDPIGRFLLNCGIGIRNTFVFIFRKMVFLWNKIVGFFKRLVPSKIEVDIKKPRFVYLRNIFQFFIDLPYNFVFYSYQYIRFVFRTLYNILCAVLSPFGKIVNVFYAIKKAQVYINRKIGGAFIAIFHYFSNLEFKKFIRDILLSPIRIIMAFCSFVVSVFRHFGKGLKLIGKSIFNFDNLRHWWEHVCDDEV